MVEYLSWLMLSHILIFLIIFILDISKEKKMLITSYYGLYNVENLI